MTVRMTAIKTPPKTSAVEAWSKGNCGALSVERKMMQPLWKAGWKSLKILKLELPYDSTIPFLSICPKELRSGSR